jgi:hypothetical protein
MHCHLVRDSIKNISSITCYLILLKQEGDFSIDFAGENLYAHGQFHGYKMTNELNNLKLDRAPHPPDSPDLSPCDFWLFGILKQKIKNRMFRCILAISQGMERVDIGRPAIYLLHLN